jgi:hypothetical protein
MHYVTRRSHWMKKKVRQNLSRSIFMETVPDPPVHEK